MPLLGCIADGLPVLEIDPGLPWTLGEERGLHLALKSGNFGAEDFFAKAFACLT